ncbi:hypothetical protein F4779DRAFT_565548 [Xylariaceae sp. FL0662B]|nr:hypothetical protein F4779DRAFT_565548 [Xylariaceae sp. FL0662B]
MHLTSAGACRVVVLLVPRVPASNGLNESAGMIAQSCDDSLEVMSLPAFTAITPVRIWEYQSKEFNLRGQIHPRNPFSLNHR